MCEAAMRCPVCRAENDQGVQCRRCRADLGILFALEQQRQHAFDSACGCLVKGEIHRASRIADGVRALRADEESRRFVACCSLLLQDFEAAWQKYRARSVTS